MPSLSARSMTRAVAERAARRTGSYFGRVQRPRMTRSGLCPCHHAGVRTSKGEAHITGSWQVSDCGLRIDLAAGCTTSQASWPRLRKDWAKSPRSRSQKSWRGPRTKSVYNKIFKGNRDSKNHEAPSSPHKPKKRLGRLDSPNHLNPIAGSRLASGQHFFCRAKNPGNRKIGE